MMDKKDLEIKLIKLIGLFDFLYSTESFPAYNQIKLMYTDLLKRIELKKADDVKRVDFAVIQSTFRLFMEAPPKDNNLGKYILDRMQEIYEIQNYL